MELYFLFPRCYIYFFDENEQCKAKMGEEKEAVISCGEHAWLLNLRERPLERVLLGNRVLWKNHSCLFI